MKHILCLYGALLVLPSWAEAQFLRGSRPPIPNPPSLQPASGLQAIGRGSPTLLGPGPALVHRFPSGGFSYWPGFGWNSPPPVGANPQLLPPPVALGGPIINTALISIQAPIGANVWVQGIQFDPFVGKRSFESPPLPPGETFIFEVRVAWFENGKRIEQKDRLELKAGDHRGMLYLAAPTTPQFKKETIKPTGGES